MRLKNEKAFTIIELIVVIAIIGILTLLAAPRFSGYVQKAHLARIQNDVKVAESFVAEKLLLNDSKLPDNWEKINTNELTQLTQEKKLYDVKGLVLDESDIEEGNYVKLAEKPFNTKLKGNFYTNQGGKVYYEDLKSGIITDEDYKDGNLDDSGKDGSDPEQPGDNNDDSNDDSEVVAPGPQPSKPVEGATDGIYTFHGEVAAKDFITGDELAQQIGLTAGTAQYSEEPWLKFTRKEVDDNVTTMFVAKKPLRYSISWDHINNVGAALGTKTVEIDGQTYKVRLMKGALTNPSKNKNSDRGAHGSEWNRMMLPIHEQAIDKTWVRPKYVEDNIKPFVHKLGSGKDGMYTDEDLLADFFCGNGSYSWTQEAPEINPSDRVYRGGDGVSHSSWGNSPGVAAHLGWRPVLELVPAS